MTLKQSSKLMLLLFALALVSCFSPAQDRTRINEVKQIWTTIPLYPGMIEVDSSSASGFDKAYISKGFKSPADYEDVKRFYVERLTKEGWQFSKERKLKAFWDGLSGEIEVEFRRGDYDLTIDYAPEDKKFGWNYGITISWR